MVSRIEDLADRITKEHPSIVAYYELSNHDDSLTVEGLTRAYGLHQWHNVDFRTAVLANYISIKRTAKRKETIQRLEKEYEDKISKM